jgi:hypothetical protein
VRLWERVIHQADIRETAIGVKDIRERDMWKTVIGETVATCQLAE